MSTDKPKVIVTGVAGFIGSHLAEGLLARGYQVIGVDCFTDYYPRAVKEANLVHLCSALDFRFVEGDILAVDWTSLLEGVSFLFHEAAQAGVRGSWSDSFSIYVRNNILATQRLLEAAKDVDTLQNFVFASSSSVYGNAEALPTGEDVAPAPVSPYGVTKLACEHLCRVYHQSFGIPMTMLRYFTVYGPRQRPDMAFHRFIRAVLQDREIVIYGDGEQTRDFTFISDAVQANLLNLRFGDGETFNIGGGARVSVNQVIRLLEEITGRQARLRYLDTQKGDARHTAADLSKARQLLGYAPVVPIREGLGKEVAWMQGALTGHRSATVNTR